MSNLEKQKVIPLLTETYLAVIKNSVDSKLFRNLYAEVDGKKTDITEDGNLSCAFFVSSILLLFKLIKELHATVSSTTRDLQESGWKIIEEPKIGSILVWEQIDFGKTGVHKHIGFYIGKDEAISNNHKSGYPTKHHWTFENKRKVELILWNSKLL